MRRTLSTPRQDLRTVDATRCFACDRPLSAASGWVLVTCMDDQDVFVGSDCHRNVRKGGRAGWQPPKGGPRLYTLACDPKVLSPG